MSKVYAAINAVQKQLSVEGISKSRKNAQQGYSFRGIDDIYNAVSGLLADAGLCIIPRCTERNQVERETKNGGALFYTTVKVEFDFVASEDGSIHTAVAYGEAMDSGDKSTNKAMSAAYKYALMQTFAIPTIAENNDADEQTHEVAARKPNSKAGAKADDTETRAGSTPAPAATAPAAESRDLQLLNAELDKYGEHRKVVEGKIVVAMGLKEGATAADIPEKKLPEAMVRLLAYGKNVAEARAKRAAATAAGAPSSASQAAGEPPFEPTKPARTRTNGKQAAGDSNLPV